MSKKVQSTKPEKKEKPQKKDKKEKKQKAKKDKNAPKRAISAFFFFQKNRRDTLKKEQPSLSNKELISKMSEEWNKMDDAQKVPFVKLAEEDKVRYANDKKEYEKTHAGSAKKEVKSPKSAKKSAKKSESDDE
jgi:structure-specific recognition protein 1